MTTRASIDTLTAVSNRLTAAAVRDLRKLMATIDQSDPTAALAVLKEAIPALVERYGDAAAAAAVDWYDEIRPAGSARYSATVGSNYPAEAVERRVGSAGQHLADGSGERFLEVMATSLDKFIKQSARNTIIENGRRDPWKPRFARVPRGATTCGFCLMLASRGAIYLTAESAGEMAAFHGNCDCQIVPIGPSDPLPEGYDPDALYQQYVDARDEAGVDARAIGEAMGLTRDLAERTVAAPSELVWRHILHGDQEGGGHLYGATVTGKTQAPSSWSEETFAEAVALVQAGGKRRETPTATVFEGLYQGAVFRVVIIDGEVASAYPLRGEGVEKVGSDGERTPSPLQSRDRTRYNELHDPDS